MGYATNDKVRVLISDALTAPAPQVSLDERMKAAGMIPLSDILAGKTPLEAFRAHIGVCDAATFGQWLAMRYRSMMTMRVQYELGDQDKDDGLYEWVFAHSAAFGEAMANWRKAYPHAATVNDPLTVRSAATCNDSLQVGPVKESLTTAAADVLRFEFREGPWECADMPTIIRRAEDGGDHHILATLKRIHNRDELYRLVNLANRSLDQSQAAADVLAEYVVIDKAEREFDFCGSYEDAEEAAEEYIEQYREHAITDGEWPDGAEEISVCRVVARVRFVPTGAVNDDGEDQYDAKLLRLDRAAEREG